MTTFTIARIYDSAQDNSSYRVLVDRLWPRGITKSVAALDDWCKELAPSPSLRTWWNHDPLSFDEFAARYRAELDDNDELPRIAAELMKHPHVTLLYGAKDPKVNHALVLSDYLREYGAATN